MYTSSFYIVLPPLPLRIKFEYQQSLQILLPLNFQSLRLYWMLIYKIHVNSDEHALIFLHMGPEWLIVFDQDLIGCFYYSDFASAFVDCIGYVQMMHRY